MQSGRNFLLRPKVLELGAAYLESMNIETLTQTYLEDLARQTGDSAALTVLDGTQIVYVARTSVRTLMRLEAHVGSRFPAYPTSMGRVLLAGLSAGAAAEIFRDARIRRADQSHSDRSGEADEAGRGMPARRLLGGGRRARVRRRRGCSAGYDQAQRVVAALNTSSHSKKISKAKLVRERLGLLQELSAQISRELLRCPACR